MFDNAWELEVGGVSKSELIVRLSERGVKLNDYARTLFVDPAFATSADTYQVRLVEVSLPEIDLPDGGRFEQIIDCAANFDLEPCPLEVAPHFRLKYLDQPEGPYLTIASPAPPPDAETPNGFYLRHLSDGLWLRGYESGPENIWQPDFSSFVFALVER